MFTGQLTQTTQGVTQSYIRAITASRQRVQVIATVSSKMAKSVLSNEWVAEEEAFDPMTLSTTHNIIATQTDIHNITMELVMGNSFALFCFVA